MTAHHAAILVCTYKRPDRFRALMESVRRLDVPDSIKVTVCVADNNPEPEIDGYVKAGTVGMPFDVLTAHESKTGYSSARNRSLTLGLKCGADIMLTTDDDLEVGENWVREHVAAHELYRADIVCGSRGRGKIRYRDGEQLSHPKRGVGTNNLSFRRHVVDPAGLGLKFDAELDAVNGEDVDFLARASDAGAKIVWSSRPRVISPEPTWSDDPAGAYAAELNLAQLAGVDIQNVTDRDRREKKWDRIAGRLVRLPVQILTALAGALLALCIMPLSRRAGLKLKVRARKNFHKAEGFIKGLLLGGRARQEVRSSDRRS